MDTPPGRSPAVVGVIRVVASAAEVWVLVELALFFTGLTVFAAAERGRGWMKEVLTWVLLTYLVVVGARWLGHPRAPITGVLAGLVLAGVVLLIPYQRQRLLSGTDRLAPGAHPAPSPVAPDRRAR